VCNPATGDCITLSYTLVQTYTTHCIPFNYLDLLDSLPSSVISYEDAFTYCALQCGEQFRLCANLGELRTWSSQNRSVLVSDWCPGPNTSNFDMFVDER